MPRRTTARRSTASWWNRRSWLAAAMLGCGGLFRPRASRGAEDPNVETAEVQRLARKAGLGPFRSSVTEHYLGIGDAPDAYRDRALEICRALALAFQKHFEDKKFAVSFPPRRLTVVVLKDHTTYAAFLGEKPGATVGGHYDLDTNRLVTFDFRPGGRLPSGVPLERLNTITLIHEATHQLTFNTGLLERQGDVPLALSEGLAMYAELWRPDGRSVLGVVNRPRLQVLIDQENEAEVWIPFSKLLTDDSLFQGKATEQLAYAQSWVFVHYALKTPEALPRFRAYLDVIRPRRSASGRAVDAAAHLGDFDRLDLALRKHAARLIRGG